jgi:serine/threonine protein kinase
VGSAHDQRAWMPGVGDVLAGKYRIEKTLGQGGMGVVLAAHHELLDQRVAIKLLQPEIAGNPEAVSRFLNEARSASRIRNEHVARVVDVGRLDGGQPYMVMEYLEGLDLEQVLAQRGPLPAAEVVDWLMQALEAVAQAHALGIIHRDLKPPNLFLARCQDGTSQVKVLDFGISKAMTAPGEARGSVTTTKALLGSPAYMSPEQLRDSKNVDVRTDIWALGVVAYELLTGSLPFDADNVVALFAAIQETTPRPLRELRPELPAMLEAAVLKCLRANQRERFSNVAELASAIAPYGTRESALCREHIERILPIGDVPAARGSNPDLPAVDPPREGHVQTGAPWATPRPGAIRRWRRPLTVVLAVGAAVLVGGLATTAVMLRRPHAAAIATEPATSSFARDAVPSSTATVAAAQSATTATAATETIPAPTASSLPTPPPSATATPTAISTAVRRAPALAPAVPRKPANCDPPYFIDAAGHKQFKIGCL